MRAIGAVVPFAGDPTLLTVNSPFDLDGVDKTPPGTAPSLGQHSMDVLREAGFDDAEIKRLSDLKAIA